MSPTSVQKCVTGKAREAGGFEWVRATDEEVDKYLRVGLVMVDKVGFEEGESSELGCAGRFLMGGDGGGLVGLWGMRVSGALGGGWFRGPFVGEG